MGPNAGLYGRVVDLYLVVNVSPTTNECHTVIDIMNKKNKIEREINTYSNITYSLNNVSDYNNRIEN